MSLRKFQGTLSPGQYSLFVSTVLKGLDLPKSLWGYFRSLLSFSRPVFQKSRILVLYVDQDLLDKDPTKTQQKEFSSLTSWLQWAVDVIFCCNFKKIKDKTLLVYGFFFHFNFHFCQMNQWMQMSFSSFPRQVASNGTITSLQKHCCSLLFGDEGLRST